MFIDDCITTPSVNTVCSTIVKHELNELFENYGDDYKQCVAFDTLTVNGSQL